MVNVIISIIDNSLLKGINMSLIKLFKSSTRLFKKDVITFLIIRRHDLGIIDEKLRYVAVKPAASVSNLRQKVWHLLDLPDYCEEIIILKSEDGHELPLTDLRKGNEPQHPYYLEVWLPATASFINNMITMDTNGSLTEYKLEPANNIFEEKVNREYNGNNHGNQHSCITVTNESKSVDKNRQMDHHHQDILYKDYEKKSELSCQISTSSIFFKLHGRTSRDNFANILLKIQSDLKTLNNKLSDLENRIKI